MRENFKADEPCVPCGHALDNEVCYHHIHTKKAHSEERIASWNLIAVCLKCHHAGFHSKGTMWMSEKYPAVKNWLERNGWYVLDLGGVPKWVHDPEVHDNVG